MQLFDISPLSDQVALDDQGRGETTFTVTSTATRPLRARVRVVPQAPAEPSWFGVDGETERSFAPGAAHQFLVRLKVPAGTPAGPIRFRLDAVSVENPDEDFTIGPTVGADVKPVPVVVDDGKDGGKWWIWVVLAAVLLVVGGIVAYLLWPDDTKAVVIPPCKERYHTIVVDRLEKLGLRVTEERRTAPGDEGFVIECNPQEGQTVEAGSEVTVVVRAGGS